MAFLNLYTLYVTSYNQGKKEERLYSNDYYGDIEQCLNLQSRLSKLEWVISTRIHSKQVWRD